MNAEQIVKNTIQRNQLVSFGDHIVLGLSGGPDSLCLLHILTGLRKELGFSLSCVHLNHLMRAEKAEEDVRWLTKHCEELDVPLTVARCDVRALAGREGVSVEEAGRNARQQALWERAEELGKNESGNVLVALAHNRDDQAETVLMRMLRGTGVHGLASMEYKRADGLIRPLLDTPRKDVEEYCSLHGLEPRWDYTNADREFTRNRLRLDLIPFLESEYNPGLKEGLAKLAGNAREDDAFLEGLALQRMSDAVFFNGGEDPQKLLRRGAYAEYPLSVIADLDPAIGKRLIKLLFARLGLIEDISYAHLNSLWTAVQSRKHGTVCAFPRNYRSEISYGRLLLYREEPEEASEKKSCGWRIVQTELPLKDAPDPRKLPVFQRVFDAEKIRGTGIPLSVRTRLPGDYIQPLGFSGTKKLQDYFVDAKVERSVRDSCPLVCIGQEVVWIFGGPIGDKYRLEDKTEIVLLLELQQIIC